MNKITQGEIDKLAELEWEETDDPCSYASGKLFLMRDMSIMESDYTLFYEDDIIFRGIDLKELYKIISERVYSLVEQASIKKERRAYNSFKKYLNERSKSNK